MMGIMCGHLVFLAIVLLPWVPLTGAPSMISYLAMVSFSWYTAAPAPVVSRRMMSISMCRILIRTNRKKIFPTITSLTWYLQAGMDREGEVSVRSEQ